MLIELFFYILSGALVGFFAGLLGIGGGLILVPILTSLFAFYLTTPDLVHLAIGTSLATILLTSFSSVIAHHRHQAVRWDIVKTLTPGILAGGFFGGWVAQFFSTQLLAQIFAVLELLMAFYMIANIQPKPHRELPGLVKQSFAGTIVGSISSLIGIGGGTLNAPYLTWHNVSIHQAIATSAACSLPVAFAGTLGYLIGGLSAENLPALASGYIYWPAFIGIVIASVFTAPIGARLAHRLPVKKLKRIFALLLILLAIKMFFFSL